jgi:hypothetical protein
MSNPIFSPEPFRLCSRTTRGYKSAIPRVDATSCSFWNATAHAVPLGIIIQSNDRSILECTTARNKKLQLLQISLDSRIIVSTARPRCRSAPDDGHQINQAIRLVREISVLGFVVLQVRFRRARHSSITGRDQHTQVRFSSSIKRRSCEQHSNLEARLANVYARPETLLAWCVGFGELRNGAKEEEVSEADGRNVVEFLRGYGKFMTGAFGDRLGVLVARYDQRQQQVDRLKVRDRSIRSLGLLRNQHVGQCALPCWLLPNKMSPQPNNDKPEHMRLGFPLDAGQDTLDPSLECRISEDGVCRFRGLCHIVDEDGKLCPGRFERVRRRDQCHIQVRKHMVQFLEDKLIRNIPNRSTGRLDFMQPLLCLVQRKRGNIE